MCRVNKSDIMTIIAYDNNDIELLIKESLLIKDKCPIINNNISSFELRTFN